MLNLQVIEINPSLYMLKDPFDVNAFLIVGEKKALLFDTGYGICDYEAAVREITSKPLTVVLGHGHLDHAGGAYQFEKVYLREPDFELCREHTGAGIRSDVITRIKKAGIEINFDADEWINCGKCNPIPLGINTVFELGNLNVEVIDMAGHTGGSIGLLICEQRILLDSDSANTHCWMFVPQSLSVREYINMLKRVKELDFDVFYVAHQDFAHGKSFFDKFIRVAENASIEKAVPYDNWPDYDPYIYTEDDCSIIVNERTLNGGLL